jgi:6-phospho-beta-glucosidase
LVWWDYVKNPESEKTGGNLIFGVTNPYLETSKWGWQINPRD